MSSDVENQTFSFHAFCSQFELNGATKQKLMAEDLTTKSRLSHLEFGVLAELTLSVGVRASLKRGIQHI